MKHCCNTMTEMTNFKCPTCRPSNSCPDKIISVHNGDKTYNQDTYWFITRGDDVIKYQRIDYCPWCGKKLFYIGKRKIKSSVKKLFYEQNKKIDLLRLINDKKISVKEADDIIEQVTDPDLKFSLQKNLGFLKSEEHAYIYSCIPSIPIKIILDWRYNGWPKKICSICNKKIELNKLDWGMNRDNRKKSGYRFEHYNCRKRKFNQR